MSQLGEWYLHPQDCLEIYRDDAAQLFDFVFVVGVLAEANLWVDTSSDTLSSLIQNLTF